MDVDSGEILALAFNPTFDPEIYVGRVEEKDLKRLAAKSANLPTMFRALAGGYPPGSTLSRSSRSPPWSRACSARTSTSSAPARR